MSMNELMQQIIAKNDIALKKLTVTIKTISKPLFIPYSHATITIEGNELFYTFNGRALFFSEEQKEPIISVPEETREVAFIPHENNMYCFMLNSKNKLESMNCTDIASGPRFTVTRNVLQVQRTEKKVFFIFKKDSNYFIDECSYDGKRWIGKIVCHNISGANVLLFASAGTFYFTVDTQVHNNEGRNLGFNADFVHQYKHILIIGIKTADSYELKILDINNNYKENYSTIISCESNSNIVGHSDVLILQSENNVFIFQIDLEAMSFQTMWKMPYLQNIYSLDFHLNKETENIVVYVLSDSHYSNITQLIGGTNFNVDTTTADDSLIFSNSFSNNNSSIETENTSNLSLEDTTSIISNNEPPIIDLEVKEDSLVCENNALKKSLILKEMELMSLTPQITEKLNLSLPTNNLLEEVRATLNKKKGSTKVEEGNKTEEPLPVDRFESYRANNTEALPEVKDQLKNENDDSSPSKKYVGLIPTSESTGTISSTRPTSPPLRNPFEYKVDKKTNEIGSSIVPHLPMLNNANEVSLNEFKKITHEANRKTIAAVESIISKKESIEPMIKEIIIKSLVPCVEACFNEMRIQIITEIKKLTSAALEISENKNDNVSKMLSSGKVSQAIHELLKLDDHAIPTYISSFNSTVLENADSTALFLLLSKICELVKKSPKDSYFKVIYFCLMELEINDFNIDQLQDLSVILRYIKDVSGFDENKHTDLCCILDITCRKIRKKAKHYNGK